MEQVVRIRAVGDTSLASSSMEPVIRIRAVGTQS